MVLGEYGQVGQHAPNRVELDQDLEQDNATIQLQSTEVTHALEPVLRHLLVMHIAAVSFFYTYSLYSLQLMHSCEWLVEHLD